MRVGIIGLGSIGTRYARLLQSQRKHIVVAYDSDSSRSSIHGLDQFWHCRPDCVLICTPPDSHVELAHAAIDRGLPTFIEKPLTNRLSDDVGYLEYLAERGNVPTLVSCNLRYHAGAATIKRWLADEAIGEVLYGRFYSGSWLPTWVPGRDYKTSYVAKTGVILDVGSHEVDLACWLLGSARLKAAMWRPATILGLECDGLAELLLEHKIGVLSSVHLNFVQQTYQRGCYLLGTKGRIEWTWEGGEYYLYDTKGNVLDGDYYEPDEEVNMMYEGQLADFLHYAETRQVTTNPIGQAIAVLDILLEAKEIGRPR